MEKLTDYEKSLIVTEMAKRCFVISKEDVTNSAEAIWNKPLFEEDCDCYKKHGRVMHNNGGNYHQLVYMIVSDDYIALIDSDTSDSFGRDGENYITVDRENFGKYQQEWSLEPDDYDFVINNRRDRVLTIINRV